MTNYSVNSSLLFLSKTHSRLKHLKEILGFTFILSLLFFSCETDKFYTNSDATLTFSSDTISFDTIFTTIGSTTMRMKVYNNYNENLEIDAIYLEGGATSDYKINIDGSPDLSIENKLLRANDSMYIFVNVTIDPSDDNLPFIVTDDIVFSTNGNQQKVHLESYGQEAYHIKLGQWGDIGFAVTETENALTGNITYDTTYLVTLENDTLLNADKPYFVHDHLYVDEGTELQLAAGVSFFIAKNKSIYIDGSIKANGTVDMPITFRGHRMDEMLAGIPYDKVPGQWGVISLMQDSYDNQFTHCNIRNGLRGILVDSLSNNDNPKVKIANCRIENMSYDILYSNNGSIEAENSLFANAGQHVLYAYAGGKYNFTNCTFGNYYGGISWARENEPSVLINNYAIEDDAYVPKDLEEANFTNCIIDGNQTLEYYLVSVDDNGDSIPAAFNFYFDHCIIKANFEFVDRTDERYQDVFWNDGSMNNPYFISPKEDWNFYLDTLSPAIDAGIVTHLESDLTETPYTNAPDLGAFEYDGSAND